MIKQIYIQESGRVNHPKGGFYQKFDFSNLAL
jgi:hypothetical protein